MMKLIYILFIYLCFACSDKSLSLDYTIQYISDPSITEQLSSDCVTEGNKRILRLKNTSSSDTLITIKHNEPFEDCYRHIGKYYFKSIGDSIVLISSSIGDVWSPFRSDTIHPSNTIEYILDDEMIKYHLRKNQEVDYVQLYYPAKFLNGKPSNYPLLKILFEYDRKNDKLIQMDFTVPDGSRSFSML